MNELGRLEDLPADYVEALKAQNLVPLWPSLRAVLPAGKPQPRTRASCWTYQALQTPHIFSPGSLLACFTQSANCFSSNSPSPMCR